MSALFQLDQLVLRRKVLVLAGAKFHIYDPAGNVVGFSHMKAFKLKEDIRIFADEAMTTQLLSIKARSIMDFGATYDVADAATGQAVGALRRKGMKSMIRDEWVFLAPGDREIGIIQEDSMALALVRRLLTNLVPQSFTTNIGGQSPVAYKQRFNPFVHRMDILFAPGANQVLDRRLAIAAAVLLGAIEGRQQ